MKKRRGRKEPNFGGEEATSSIFPSQSLDIECFREKRTGRGKESTVRYSNNYFELILGTVITEKKKKKKRGNGSILNWGAGKTISFSPKKGGKGGGWKR